MPYDSDANPDTIRTCGLHLRRVALYPAELRVHLLLTRCLREFLAGVKRSIPISQVLEFLTSFRLLFGTKHLDTCLRSNDRAHGTWLAPMIGH
jgi:hypothetical protein